MVLCELMHCYGDDYNNDNNVGLSKIIAFHDAEEYAINVMKLFSKTVSLCLLFSFHFHMGLMIERSRYLSTILYG